MHAAETHPRTRYGSGLHTDAGGRLRRRITSMGPGNALFFGRPDAIGLRAGRTNSDIEVAPASWTGQVINRQATSVIASRIAVPGHGGKTPGRH